MADLEFKKCPFCGSETPMLDVSIVVDEYFGFIWCRHCDAGLTRRYGMGGSLEEVKADLMKRWNRRADQEVDNDAE